MSKNPKQIILTSLLKKYLSIRKGFSNKVEGWINCDQLELTTSRDEVYEGNEVYTDLLDMSLNTDKDDKILDFHMTYMRTFTTRLCLHIFGHKLFSHLHSYMYLQNNFVLLHMNCHTNHNDCDR